MSTASRPGLLDKGWENTQIKVFGRWVAKQLKQRGIDFNDVTSDFSDGTKLINLMEILGKEPMDQKWTKAPKSKFQALENLTIALNYITQKKGIKLVGIGSNDIYDKNLKLTLGLTWTLILKYSIEEITVEEATARDALMIWVKKNTAGYDGVSVTNFTTSWSSGLAFCALINRFRPDVIDYKALDKSDKVANATAAVEACKKIGLFVFLDPEDIAVDVPDEKSVVTQVAEYFHFFASDEKVKQMAEKIGRTIALQKEIQGLLDEYQRVAQEAVDAMNTIKAYVESQDYEKTVPAIRARLTEVIKYSQNDRPKAVEARTKAQTAWTALITKCKSSSRPVPQAPEGLAVEDLIGTFTELESAATSERKRLSEELKQVEEAVIADYEAKAAEHINWVKEKEVEIANMEGSNEEKIQKLNELDGEITEKKGGVSELMPEYDGLVENNLHLNVQDTPASVEAFYDNLADQIRQAIKVIDQAIAAAKGLEISEEQLAEFRDTFNHFDKDKNGTLQYYELKACLTALGETSTDDECKEIIAKYSDGAADLQFDQYVKFMLEKFSKEETAQTTKDAFMAITGSNPIITDDQIDHNFSPEEAEYLKATLPPTDGGYDFQSWADGLYA